jgi:hypothetical protein
VHRQVGEVEVAEQRPDSCELVEVEEPKKANLIVRRRRGQ